MPTSLPTRKYRSEHTVLAESEFVDSSLERSKFHDANLRVSEFNGVAIYRFDNPQCLSRRRLDCRRELHGHAYRGHTCYGVVAGLS